MAARSKTQKKTTPVTAATPKPKTAVKTASTKKAEKTESTKRPAASTRTTVRTVSARSVSENTFSTRLKKAFYDVSPAAVLAEFVGVFILTAVTIASLSGKFGLLPFYSASQIEKFVAIPDNAGKPLTTLLQQATTGSFAITAILIALAIAVLTLVLGRISGAQLNPAITLAGLIQRRVRMLQGVFLIVAQFLGGMLALAALARIGTFGADTSLLVLQRGDWNTFSGELLGAFIFGFGAASALLFTRSVGKQAAVVAGAFLLGSIVATVGGSKGLLNPALSIGVGAINAGKGLDSQFWMAFLTYIAAPLVGIVVGMLFYRLISREVPMSTSIERDV